jgi:hypothetical protein
MVERLVVVALAALAIGGLVATIFLGPTVLVLVLFAGLLVFTMEPLVRRTEAKETARHASEAGVHGSITLWRKVLEVTGHCPTGTTPHKGQTFVFANGEIWPKLCPHAEQAIMREIEHMEHDHDLPDQPIYFHDADHELHLEVYRAPAHLRAA